MPCGNPAADKLNKMHYDMHDDWVEDGGEDYVFTEGEDEEEVGETQHRLQSRRRHWIWDVIEEGRRGKK